jgi:hypothetical protein
MFYRAPKESRSLMPKRKVVSPKPSLSYETATCQDYVEQGDICCEQARSAALKKRFVAALGLFRTAQNLYSRAVAVGGDACTDARDRLQNSKYGYFNQTLLGQLFPC